ncbi:UNKNOWN [Stylonychia lemnae]|uniref:Tpr domain containing protein n=1 Tax=Stylonychia lemnae TaxID=5949 RepID=A0A078ATE0_STYLE|nr:UNKNOWN [Stylonychia lemnae]|eukprot:CDW84133.1 UNKNOWN [Stylonychia lemnae]
MAETNRFFYEKHLAHQNFTDELLIISKKEDTKDNIKFRLSYLIILKEQNMTELCMNETLKFLSDYLIIKQEAWKYLVQGYLVLIDMYNNLCVYHKAMEKLELARNLIESYAPNEQKLKYLAQICLKSAYYNSEFFKEKSLEIQLQHAQKIIDQTKSKEQQAELYKIKGVNLVDTYQMDKAQGYFEKQLKVLKEIHVEHHPSIIKVYLKLANCCQNLRGDMARLRNAEKYTDKALELAKELFDIQDDSGDEKDFEHLLIVKILIFKAKTSARMFKREDFMEKYQRIELLINSIFKEDETNSNKKILNKISEDASDIGCTEIKSGISRLIKKIIKKNCSPDGVVYAMEYLGVLNEDFSKNPFKAINTLKRGMNKAKDQFGSDTLIYVFYEAYQLLIDLQHPQNNNENFLSLIEQCRLKFLKHFEGLESHYMFSLLYMVEISYYLKQKALKQKMQQQSELKYLNQILQQKCERMIEIDQQRSGKYSTTIIDFLGELANIYISSCQFEKAYEKTQHFMDIIEKMPWLQQDKLFEDKIMMMKVVYEDTKILTGRKKDWKDFEDCQRTIIAKQKLKIGDLAIIIKKCELLQLMNKKQECLEFIKSTLVDNDKTKKYSDGKLANLIMVWLLIAFEQNNSKEFNEAEAKWVLAEKNDTLEFKRAISQEERELMSRIITGHKVQQQEEQQATPSQKLMRLSKKQVAVLVLVGGVAFGLFKIFKAKQ